ncbi:AbrB family transcriptional regulator [Lysobacteraceae bacterium NML120232]|nr:AbrB family transcriptional regulator [Xanthomonadaceae bacterium NML08-0793]PJK10686.1 AbrB family transcriptional regulator [Xanthomonadaceae bacterium NML120232]
MAVIDSKGRITLPASVRAALGVDVGDRVEFVPLANGRFELEASILPVTALKGSIAKPKRPVSIEGMSTTIMCRAVGRWS